MNEEKSSRVRTVLFDLDGTLADTAPDLAYALNVVLSERGEPPLALDTIRPLVSHGGRALLELAFGPAAERSDFEQLYARFLDVYAANVANESRLFPGMDAVLEHIEGNGWNWGVVTNKWAWLTDPLMQAMGLDTRAACVVSGDTTSHRKPHPEPLLYACSQAGSEPAECLYVGDAERDIQAGRDAGMRTVVALFGYIHPDEDPASWGADGAVERPEELICWIS